MSRSRLSRCFVSDHYNKEDCEKVGGSFRLHEWLSEMDDCWDCCQLTTSDTTEESCYEGASKICPEIVGSYEWNGKEYKYVHRGFCDRSGTGICYKKGVHTKAECDDLRESGATVPVWFGNGSGLEGLDPYWDWQSSDYLTPEDPSSEGMCVLDVSERDLNM